MNIPELAAQCVTSINQSGNNARIIVTLPGTWGKRDTRRLCRGGPVGRINGEDATDPARLIVSFGALDVLAFLTARGLIQAVGPDGQRIGGRAIDAAEGEG